MRRTSRLLLLLVLSLVSSLASPGQTGARMPAGQVEARKALERSEREIPPPVELRPKTDAKLLQSQAQELSRLSETIPGDMAKVSKGELPKDLSERLKRIEKLAKKLRNEVVP